MWKRKVSSPSTSVAMMPSWQPAQLRSSKTHFSSSGMSGSTTVVQEFLYLPTAHYRSTCSANFPINVLLNIPIVKSCLQQVRKHAWWILGFVWEWRHFSPVSPYQQWPASNRWCRWSHQRLWCLPSMQFRMNIAFKKFRQKTPPFPKNLSFSKTTQLFLKKI